MKKWKQLFSSANRAFKNKRFGEALSLYETALSHLDTLFAEQIHALHADEWVSAKLTNYHKIATTYVAIDQLLNAEKHYQIAHVFLLRLIKNQDLPHRFRHAAKNACHHSYTEWLSFVERFQDQIPLLSNILDHDG